MSTIGKIIIAIAIIYIITLLLVLDLKDLSWEVNRDNYFRLIAAMFIIFIQFVKRKKKR